jgi:hypothetical protein
VNRRPERETPKLGSKNDWGWALESDVDRAKFILLGISYCLLCTRQGGVFCRCARCAKNTHCKSKSVFIDA